jgi:hypothetical protein
MSDDAGTIRYASAGGEVTVILIGCQFLCTACEQWKPGGEFGLRRMQDGSIRNQPQCKPCRGEY